MPAERGSRKNIQNGRNSLLYHHALRHWKLRRENKQEGKELEILWKDALIDFFECEKRVEVPGQSQSWKKYGR